MTTIATELLTVPQVAERLQLSASAIYQKVERGEIPAVKLGPGPKAPVRIDADELDAWLRSPRGQR